MRKGPIVTGGRDQNRLASEGASVVIWTTTPWTIPGNRAISFSSKIGYGLFEVTAAPEGNWAKAGDKYVLSDKLAADVMKAAKVETFEKRRVVSSEELSELFVRHPLAALGYGFDVPLLDGDHVTDDTGTGFVHTAPGHGTDDYQIWMANQAELKERGIDTTIPFTVDAEGVLTADAPGFAGKRVLTEKGDKGDANEAVIAALEDANALIARAPEASIPALLALQEAGHLPQHAAVVHRDGQAAQGDPQERQPDPAPARHEGDRGDRVGAGVG